MSRLVTAEEISAWVERHWCSVTLAEREAHAELWALSREWQHRSYVSSKVLEAAEDELRPRR
jgi:hypothetical protein